MQCLGAVLLLRREATSCAVTRAGFLAAAATQQCTTLVSLSEGCVAARWLSSSINSSSSSSSSSSPGLFGISRLQHSSDFTRWAEEAKQRCNELVGDIMAAPPDAAVVGMVDDISDTICQVYDSAECVRNIHPDPSWRQAATQACLSLASYLAEINHHEGLYNKLLDVQAAYARSAAAAGGGLQQQQHQHQHQHQAAAGIQQALSSSSSGPLLSPQQLSGFCPETLVVAHKYQQDFEKFGIHLSNSSSNSSSKNSSNSQQEAQRGRVADLLAANQHYPAQFNATLADPKKLGTVEVSSSSSSWWGRGGRGGVSVPLDSGSIHHFLATTEDEEARRQVYLAGARGPEANLVLLDNMLTARHQLGTLLGFNSYAAFRAADGTLAGSPDAAEAFLLSLAEGCRDQADEELRGLAALKRKHTGSKGAVLQPWDQEFYTRQLAASKPYVKALTAASPYLQLGSVLQGLNHLLTQLMGLQLQQQPLQPGEGWAPGVVKLGVSCQELGPLGVLYLDLVARPGKPGASGILYPLRCGRQLAGGAYQQPILCLMGNLSASVGAHTSSSSSSGSSDTDATRLLMTWREFRTLLHEMGHAVHSLVSRTRYQHVWGTRCSQDLVEVPSHLWEHFAGSPQSLALLARHKGSREPMPPKLAATLCEGWSSFSSVTPALELQQQALLSLIDLRYHGSVLPADRGGSSTVWQQLAQSYSSIPPPEDTCPQARFSHLTIYGACYYSYLYARCISEALWETHLADNPLDPAAGRHLRKLLLQPGGSTEALELLTAALGGQQARDKVLVQQKAGWSPNPASLLHSLSNKQC